MNPNKENIEKWCAALEAMGDRQCIGALRDYVLSGNGEYVEQNCAAGIGVLVALENGLPENVVTLDTILVDGDFMQRWPVKENAWDGSALPDWIAAWYGVPKNPFIVIDGRLNSVTNHNDSGASFWDIAQGLRAEYLKDEG
jgi:hypothetical protein